MLSNYLGFFGGRGLSVTVLLARVLVLVTAIPVHEFAHAWAADKMGDPSARYRRRLTLNPLDHIDPVGALMILLLGFGFAKPVPINSMNFTDRKKGIVVTSLAGPAANILMALVSLALAKFLLIPYVFTRLELFRLLREILSWMVSINLSLAVFNLLPIPPLDGWHAVAAMLPSDLYWKIAPYEQQIMWLVLILAATGVLGPVIGFFITPLYWVLNVLTLPIDLLVGMVL